MLVVTPVSLTLAAPMFDHALTLGDSLLDLCQTLLMSLQIALAHQLFLGQRLFLFKRANKLCRIVLVSIRLRGAIADDGEVDHADSWILRNCPLK